MLYDKEKGRGSHKHCLGAMVSESFRRDATQDELIARAREAFFPDDTTDQVVTCLSANYSKTIRIRVLVLRQVLQWRSQAVSTLLTPLALVGIQDC